MDLNIAISHVLRSVRGLENRVNGEQQSGPLRGWMATEGLKKPDIDELIGKGHVSAAAVNAVINGVPYPPTPVPVNKMRGKKSKVG